MQKLIFVFLSMTKTGRSKRSKKTRYQPKCWSSSPKIPKCKAPMKEASTHQKDKCRAFKFVAPDRNLPALTADGPSLDRKGSVNVITPVSFAFKISLMLLSVLGVKNLSGMGFFEVGAADGRVSQFLAWACGMVCFGVEHCVSGFTRNKNAYVKMIESKEWIGKIIPVCYLGNFLKLKSFCGAKVAYSWVQGNQDCESHVLDVFNADDVCKVLITNWFADKEFPNWYKDAGKGCTFEFIGTMQNTAQTAKRVMHVYAKKDCHVPKRIRKHKTWKKKDDILGGKIRKCHNKVNLLRSSKDNAKKTAFFKSLLDEIGSIKQEADKEESDDEESV